jgi:hypothetical protein
MGYPHFNMSRGVMYMRQPSHAMVSIRRTQSLELIRRSRIAIRMSWVAGRQTPLNTLRTGVFACFSRPSHTNLASVAQPSPWREFRMNSPEQESTSSTKRSITTRLESATRELNELEELVKSGTLDSRVLSEFREAVDHVRSTTWAVQKWIGLSDGYREAIPLPSSDNVR